MIQKDVLTKRNTMRTQQILEVDNGGPTFLFSPERPCTTLSLSLSLSAIHLFSLGIERYCREIDALLPIHEVPD
jgi:hypothetical protein